MNEARVPGAIPAAPGQGLLVTVPCALAIALAFAWWHVFTRPFSMDEGYLLITVRSFLDGHALYDEVFTQYGPVYYLHEWLLHGLLAVPLTQDATRLLCVGHWLATAALLGVAAGRWMQSTLAGVFVFLQAAAHLALMANEPGHPQELIALLLAAALVVVGRRETRWRGELLAVLAALLVLIKINVGILFGIAFFLALRSGATDRFARPPWKWLLFGVCVALPLVLMRRHLGADWCRNYAILSVCAIASTLLFAQRTQGGFKDAPVRLPGPALAFLATMVLLLGMARATGSTWTGLLDGLLLTPLRTPEVALRPVLIPTAVIPSAVLSAVLAALVHCRAGCRRVNSTLPLLKAVYGGLGAFILVGGIHNQFCCLLPWAWLVIARTEGETASASGTPWARTFLGLVAVWQGLQAYPIGGTQLTVATLLLPVTYALCLHDAWQALELRWQKTGRETLVVRLGNSVTRWAATVAMFVLFALGWTDLREARARYVAWPALQLPGADLVRYDPETTAIYREVSAFLARECDTFVSYPGHNSLHFWSGRPPPTHLNATGWGLLSHAQQEEVLAALRQAERPMLVLVIPAIRNWSGEGPEPLRPLVRFAREECREVRRIDPFVFLVLQGREPRSAPAP